MIAAQQPLLIVLRDPNSYPSAFCPAYPCSFVQGSVPIVAADLTEHFVVSRNGGPQCRDPNIDPEL